MSVVYLAEHIGLGRKVAFKVLAPQLADEEGFRERFVRESRLAASIDHPNIVPIYDAGEVDGLLYIGDGAFVVELISATGCGSTALHPSPRHWPCWAKSPPRWIPLTSEDSSTETLKPRKRPHR